MTDGIMAIATRIAQLRSEFGMTQTTTATSATSTSTTGTTGTAGSDFATQLKAAQAKAAQKSRSTGKAGSADGPAPTNHKKSKIYGEEKLTAATKKMVAEIDARFGPFPAIGGWRAAEDGGEHPRGRAADFMLSSEGRLPSAAMREKGDQIAAWAKKNAKRLGVKYIIWNQRIWNPLRADEGWRPMSDRGSITQNHKDHVHISMN